MLSITCFNTVIRELERRVIVCVMITPTVTSAVVSATGASSLGEVAIVGLIVLLTMKEFCSVTEGSRFNVLSRHLNVVLIPLLIVFVLILTVRLV